MRCGVSKNRANSTRTTMQENAPSCVKNPPTLQEWRDKINEIKIVTPSGCWECNFKPKSNGYVAIGIKGSVKSAHRAAYEVFVGEIPNGLLACHKCDNRKCFNPEHIFIGTYKDNMQDASLKKRTLHGFKNKMARLSPEDFVKLRELRLSGLSYRKCANRLGISTCAAWKFLVGDSYKYDQDHLGEFKCPEYNKHTKLTAEIVRSLYNMVLSGKSQTEAGKAFGLCSRTVFSAFETKKWIREIPELANRVKRKSPTRAPKPAP